MKHDERFYLEGMTTSDKIHNIVERLEEIQDRLEEVAYEVNEDKLRTCH